METTTAWFGAAAGQAKVKTVAQVLTLVFNSLGFPPLFLKASDFFFVELLFLSG